MFSEKKHFFDDGNNRGMHKFVNISYRTRLETLTCHEKALAHKRHMAVRLAKLPLAAYRSFRTEVSFDRPATAHV
jgi:hypothetical protein